ncbi:MAG: hypothetical protein ACRDTD_26095 [Pseudonocardiaceae bacterium]
MDHRYLDAAVEQLRALPAEAREHDVLNEDVARLSRLKHTNLKACPSTADDNRQRQGGYPLLATLNV